MNLTKYKELLRDLNPYGYKKLALDTNAVMNRLGAIVEAQSETLKEQNDTIEDLLDNNETLLAFAERLMEEAEQRADPYTEAALAEARKECLRLRQEVKQLTNQLLQPYETKEGS